MLFKLTSQDCQRMLTLKLATLMTYCTDKHHFNCRIFRFCGSTLEKTERAIRNGQSRDTVNVGYTRHRTKTNNLETLSTWGTQARGRRQYRDTVNVGYTRHRTKTIQRHCQRGVHKTEDEDNPETLSSWGTQDTGRRQTIQRHCQHGVHKTQDKDKQYRDTVNVGYTRHRTRTNNIETLSTWGT